MSDASTVTLPRADLVLFLHALEIAHSRVEIAAEIIHDLVPLKDADGDLCPVGRRLRFLASGIEREIDESHAGLKALMEGVGMTYGKASGCLGG